METIYHPGEDCRDLASEITAYLTECGAHLITYGQGISYEGILSVYHYGDATIAVEEHTRRYLKIVIESSSPVERMNISGELESVISSTLEKLPTERLRRDVEGKNYLSQLATSKF